MFGQMDDVAEIRRLSDAWTAAVANADLATLEQLLADDVVVIHGSGRQLSGKEAVLEDLGDSLQQFRIDQSTSHEETVVAGEWAFDRAVVQTTITRRPAGTSQSYNSRTFTVMRRSAGGAWQIARVIGVIIR